MTLNQNKKDKKKKPHCTRVIIYRGSFYFTQYFSIEFVEFVFYFEFSTKVVAY